MLVNTVIVLATKGEPVTAETVAGDPIDVVEFFSPEVFAAEEDRDLEHDGLTVDVPVALWEHMEKPSEITFTIWAGNTLEESDGE